MNLEVSAESASRSEVLRKQAAIDLYQVLDGNISVPCFLDFEGSHVMTSAGLAGPVLPYDYSSTGFIMTHVKAETLLFFALVVV